MKMNYSKNPERERILRQALVARTEAEVTAACQELDRWVQAHPEDQSIRDAYEPLTLRQMAFEEARLGKAAAH